ncbi:MAG: hypothetical protein IJ097_02065 [Bacilli bacterium]|nr:hypothetical protein [Bacilli bacterium]
MKKINMTYEELRIFFERYNVYTLDSIYIMLNIIGENDSKKINKAFNTAYNKKYNEEKENFEGRNEYDYITMVGNFDLIEITNNINELSDKELGFITDIVKTTMYTLREDRLEKSIEPALDEYLRAYDKEFIKRLKPAISNLTKKEIKEFFNKYNTVELEAFDTILEYTKDYNIRDIRRIKKEVYNTKYNELTNNYEVSVKPINFKLSDISKKNKELNNTELDFLHLLVESASLYLDSIQEFDYVYKEVFEEFDSGDYPVLEMSELLDSIEEEKDNRKVKSYKKVI